MSSRRPSQPCACGSAWRWYQQRLLATTEPPSAALACPSLSDKGPAYLPEPLWQDRSAPAGWWSARPAALAAASTFWRSRVPLVQLPTSSAATAEGSSPKPAKTSAPLQGRQRQLPPAQPDEITVGPTAWRARGRLALANGRWMGPAVGPASPPAGNSSGLAVGALLRGVGRGPTPHLAAFSTGASVAHA